MSRYTDALRLLIPVLLAAALAGCDSSSTSPTQPPPPRRVDSLVVTPVVANVSAGNTVHFTATAYDSVGGVISDAAIVWTSTTDSVATVDPYGRATGESPGIAGIIATSGAASDSVTLTVSAATPGWLVQTSGITGTSVNAVHFAVGGLDGCAVGESGRIVHTDDAGTTWKIAASGTSVSLNGVWLTSRTRGWAVGGTGTVLFTSDGGASWQRVSNVNTSNNLTAVCFAGPDTGWIVGSNGLILRTTNAGTSWSRTNPTTSTLEGVAFHGNRDGWAVGDNGVILGTHDGGTIWFRVLPSLTASALRAVWRVSEPRANAVGAAGVTPRSSATPDSTAWELDNSGGLNDLYGVNFATEMIGFAVGSNGNGIVLRSDDGGVSWNPQIAGSSARLRAVYFASPQRGWAVGDNGTILHTVTGGQP